MVNPYRDGAAAPQDFLKKAPLSVAASQEVAEEMSRAIIDGKLGTGRLELLAEATRRVSQLVRFSSKATSLHGALKEIEETHGKAGIGMINTITVVAYALSRRKKARIVTRKGDCTINRLRLESKFCIRLEGASGLMNSMVNFSADQLDNPEQGSVVLMTTLLTTRAGIGFHTTVQDVVVSRSVVKRLRDETSRQRGAFNLSFRVEDGLLTAAHPLRRDLLSAGLVEPSGDSLATLQAALRDLGN